MGTDYRKPEEDPTLQMLLESRIKRHGLVNSYNRGCRCERCKKAMSIRNAELFATYKDGIKLSKALRHKYQIACRSWVEEFFPEVAEAIKKELEEGQ
mgnify:CR=1 FL=1